MPFALTNHMVQNLPTGRQNNLTTSKLSFFQQSSLIFVCLGFPSAFPPSKAIFVPCEN